MKKILIITYYWPPASGPGVQRTLKFCKYLPAEGIQPIVLTVKDGSYQSIDHSLIDDIPKGMKVVKTKSFELYRALNRVSGSKSSQPSVGMIGLQKDDWISKTKKYARANAIIPDMRKGWNKYALKAARKIIAEDNISIIYSTGPPHSTHLIAKELHGEFNVKWIADFRDPWVNIFYNKLLPRTKRTIAKDQALEDSVVNNCNQMLVVSEGLKNEFSDRAKSINVIYNGYDEDDFYDRKDVVKNEKFTISYIGNFKPNQNVPSVWKALNELGANDPDFLSSVQISIVGNIDESILTDISQNGLTDSLKIHGFQPHHYAVEQMIKSDLLLFIIPEVKDNHLILTGKLFEYLAAGTQLLSVGPVDGNASSILTECGRDKMIDYANKDSISTAIKEAYTRWVMNGKSSKKLAVNDQIKKYSRQGQTKSLAQIIHQI